MELLPQTSMTDRSHALVWGQRRKVHHVRAGQSGERFLYMMDALVPDPLSKHSRVGNPIPFEATRTLW
jgi:hypothetical protein